MSTQNNEIFSSTGNLGTSLRQDERLYTNEGYSDEPDMFFERYDQQLEQATQRSAEVSRVVFRALIGEQTREQVLASELAADVEVLLPITSAQSLIYIARNMPHRLQGGASIESFVEETTVQKVAEEDIAQHIIDAGRKGYEWADTLTDDDIPQIHDLWGETFGWEKNEVENLHTRLITQREGPGVEKTVWLSMARHGGDIVSAAMAERLMLPSHHGGIINVIESTEWRVRKDHQRRNNGNAPRLMVGTLALLNAQILSDIGTENTLIMAECNLRSRADRVGNMAGFSVPSRQFGDIIIPQIVQHNVQVNDGQGGSGEPLPHFLFQYLAPLTIGQVYTPDAIDELLSNAEIGE